MDTRDRFLAAALRLFAEKGFYGASMDQIAKELGLTKQALIHHFGSKEKLYGAVLAQISEHLLSALGEAPYRFVDAVERIYAHTLQHGEETQLLMRELLERGFIVSTGGGQREVLVLTPPLSVAESQLEAFVAELPNALQASGP